MSGHFGIPGIDGSLGTCAICGDTFLLQIITGERIESFNFDGVEKTLYAHKSCRPKIREGMPLEELPQNSPIRIAFEKHNQSLKP